VISLSVMRFMKVGLLITVLAGLVTVSESALAAAAPGIYGMSQPSRRLCRAAVPACVMPTAYDVHRFRHLQHFQRLGGRFLHHSSASMMNSCAASTFFEMSTGIVNVSSGLLLLLGCVLAIANAFLYMLNRISGSKWPMLAGFDEPRGGHPKDFRPPPVQLARVRLQLGSLIMLALTLLVASDVIETIVKPVHAYTFESMYKLSIVAILRTGLSYFLAREVKELEEEIEQYDGKRLTI